MHSARQILLAMALMLCWCTVSRGADDPIDRYFDYEEMTAFLYGLAARHPDIVQVTSLGETREGRQLWCVRLGNPQGLPLEGVAGELSMLRWHDEHPQEHLFFDWRPFQHPQLGAVEIGGWNRAIWHTAPRQELPQLAEKAAQFTLHLARQVPRLEWALIEKRQEADGVHRILLELRNDGPIPTTITAMGAVTHPFDGLTAGVKGIAPEQFLEGSLFPSVEALEAGGSRQLGWRLCGDLEGITVEAQTGRGAWAGLEL